MCVSREKYFITYANKSEGNPIPPPPPANYSALQTFVWRDGGTSSCLPSLLLCVILSIAPDIISL